MNTLCVKMDIEKKKFIIEMPMELNDKIVDAAKRNCLTKSSMVKMILSNYFGEKNKDV